jgi:NAD(P)-dependent dehydrogenase (short-subunit alcohol dehydrogenase family)
MGLVEGKRGLVTGAASGIGRSCAVGLGGEGASVLVTDLASQREGGEETVRLIERAGGQAAFAVGDVTSEEDHRRLVQECVAAFGGLDFAHNNAGITLHGTVEDTEAAAWNALLAINLTGAWLGLKHQMAYMRAHGGGSIVNTSSLAGVMAFRGMAAYVAAKHGLVGLTRAAALEGADAGIRVNAIIPTAVRTPQLEEFDPEISDQLVAPQAIKRISDPEEVAEAVIWLVSDRSSLTTGADFKLDLGTTAGYSN